MLCQSAEAVVQATVRNFVPWVLVVGTYLDKVSNDRVLEINEELMKMSTTAYRNVLIHKFFNEVVFVMNAVAPTLEEQGQLHQCILKAVERDSIHMPFRMCVFDLDLEQHSGVVQKEECYKIGQRLGMEIEEVECVFRFFNRCAFKFSYPDAFPHLPFAKMNPLLRRLSSITQENDPRGNSDTCRLRMKGLFNKSFLYSQ